jgi:hypothetical protein
LDTDGQAGPTPPLGAAMSHALRHSIVFIAEETIDRNGLLAVLGPSRRVALSHGAPAAT